MSDRSAENKPSFTNAELCDRIAGLEETLLEKERIAEALQHSEKRYRRLFESAKDGILILDADTGRVVDVNPYLLQLLRCSYEAIYGQYIWELGPFKDIAASKEAFKALQENEYIRYEDLPLETCDGQPVFVEFVSNVYLVDNVRVIQCNIRDITARKRADAERVRLMAAIDQAGDAIVITDPLGTIQFVNPAFERTTGYSREEALGRNTRILGSGKQDQAFYRNLWDTIAGGAMWTGRVVNKRGDGSFYTGEMTISPVRDPAGRIVNYVAVQRDITEHLRLENQLLQNQKLKAIGLLAGGVAHDFNNMLSVILGQTDLALTRLGPADPLHFDLLEIQKAALRSADLTRQLLAFARKQTIVPVALDLNENVESMLKMLRRLIGENIELVWHPRAGLNTIKIDPAQLSQILANLCVNARDAIADVGRITIETQNVAFDEMYCARHAGFVAGQYVLLAISDDGCGMDEQTVNQIFEPFFTSKEFGRGTGLGLATVYGIVEQNNGFINVYSEPGKGTTFKIYFARHVGQPSGTTPDHATGMPPCRGGTVLLVEDEPALLKLSQAMLERLGYRVLAAGTPVEAIALATEHASEIRLLLTDIVMPEMNGCDLVERLQTTCPGIKNLFMSGYTADVIVHQGVLDNGVNFLQKPFSLKDLATKVSDAFDGPDPPVDGSPRESESPTRSPAGIGLSDAPVSAADSDGGFSADEPGVGIIPKSPARNIP